MVAYVLSLFDEERDTSVPVIPLVQFKLASVRGVWEVFKARCT